MSAEPYVYIPVGREADHVERVDEAVPRDRGAAGRHATRGDSLSAVVYTAKGAFLSGVDLFRPGTAYGPVAMVNRGQRTYVLFSFRTGGGSVARYGVCAFNHLTQTILWARQLSFPSANAEFAAADMTIDAAGTTLFVTGTYRGSTLGASEAYAASLSTAGTLNWHRHYAVAGYEFGAGNIFFRSGTAIYISGIASTAQSILNRAVVVLAIDSAGTLLNRRMLKYAPACQPHRLIEPTVKRAGSAVMVVASSIVGADGNGVYFIARLTPALALSAYSTFSPGSVYPNRGFEFVNANQNLLVNGVSSFLSTPTPGIVNLRFDLTPNFVAGHRYTSLNTPQFSTWAAAAYHPQSNQVVTMVTDPLNAGTYYHLRSTVDGTIGCDMPYQQSKASCQLLASQPAMKSRPLPGAMVPIPHFLSRLLTITEWQTCPLPSPAS